VIESVHFASILALALRLFGRTSIILFRKFDGFGLRGSKRIWPAGRSATAFGRAIYPDSSGLFFAPSNIVDNQSHLPDLF
jgi:hypothetical protein